MLQRDNFTASTRRIIALRVGYLCSHPGHRALTTGPKKSGEKGFTDLGVAAHITAASPGGPRFDPNISIEQRRDVSNGIWLCQNHAKLIDDDPKTYTVELLRDWKRSAEEFAERILGKAPDFEEEDDKLPIYVPHIKPTERGRFTYSTRFVPFVGRERELAHISEFLNTKEPFLWTAVSGPAGSGKSRLLLEVCLLNKDSWQVGFIDRHVSNFDWRAWRPTRPTLLIMDYASISPNFFRQIFHGISRKTNSPNYIRLVVLDRATGEDWERRLFGNSSDLQFALSMRFKGIHLAPLSLKHAEELSSKILYGSDIDSISFSHVLENLRLPLFVAMSAFALDEGRLPSQWGPDTLMRDWLYREKEMCWQPNSVTESEVRLLCLACISGAIPPSLPLSNKFEEFGIVADDISTSRYEILVGKPTWKEFAPLEPDILGEFLVLETMKELHPARPIFKDFLQLAWELDPENTSGFLIRISQDFVGNDVCFSILSYLPKDLPSSSDIDTSQKPNLQTLWSEAVASSLASTFKMWKPKAVTALIEQISSTPLGHKDIRYLRSIYGNDLFDDPLSHSYKIMMYIDHGSTWNYGQARDLALRISDIRRKHARNLHSAMENFSERRLTGEVKKLLKAAEMLLEREGHDRSVRYSLPWALSVGMRQMQLSGEPQLALKALAAIERCYLEIYSDDSKENNSSDPESDILPSTQDLKTAIDIANKSGDVLPPDIVYEVFSQTGDDNDAIIEIYAKAIVNYLIESTREATGRPEEAIDLFEKLYKLCYKHHGAFELTIRVMEAGGPLIEILTINYRNPEVELLIEQLTKIASDFNGIEIELTNALANVVNGYIRIDDLQRAEHEFKKLIERLSITKSIPDEFEKTVCSIIVNLASSFLSKEEIDKSNKYIDFLLRIRHGHTNPSPQIIHGMVIIRLNQVGVAIQNGQVKLADDAINGIKEEVVDTTAPQTMILCLQACVMRATAESYEIDSRALQNILQIVTSILGQARNKQDLTGWSEVFKSVQSLSLQLANKNPKESKEILQMFKELAIARFYNGKKHADQIDKLIQSI